MTGICVNNRIAIARKRVYSDKRGEHDVESDESNIGGDDLERETRSL